MSYLPMLLLALWQREIDYGWYKYALDNGPEKLPFSVRAAVINQYRKKARRASWQTSE